ncbi:hypothetical protein Sango_2764900 [Sesamum angolense]|uniref:Uncharacterized protein n=1 Tax=Sesamum angolense TaxID=2727404 RepID=A0AAE1T7P4_9LAMI|nr:hypothetical protein Sango_2764900 [Sesamum angolense]
MDINKKTTDNLNARKNLKIICNHPELELDERRPNVMPKVVYTLTKEQKRRVCEWICGLKFPDGYASNLTRCIDMMELQIHDMKSHDCHVFIQKLISIVFRTCRAKLHGQRATKVSSLGSQFRSDIGLLLFVNGYNFQTERHNTSKSTMDCGAIGTSRNKARENNDKNEDDDEDSGKDNKTDNDEYEET